LKAVSHLAELLILSLELLLELLAPSAELLILVNDGDLLSLNASFGGGLKCKLAFGKMPMFPLPFQGEGR